MTDTPACQCVTAVKQASRGRLRGLWPVRSDTAETDISIVNADKSAISYDDLHGYPVAASASAGMTLADAGAAIRRMRERRGWTLDDLAARTELGVMVLSYLERGERTPRKKTVSRLEGGLGWPPGFFYELVNLAGSPDELDRLIDSVHKKSQPPTSLAVSRISGADVFEDYAEAYSATIESVIDQLPSQASPRFINTVTTALTQCAKGEVLAANSWRVAAVSDREAAARLLPRLRDFELKRRTLLDRVPDSVAARFDAACRRSELPDAMVGVLTGLTSDEVWQIRTGGAVPEGANALVAAFIRAVGSGYLDGGTAGMGQADGS